MKKILSVITVFMVLLSVSSSVFATELMNKQEEHSFEITLDEALSMANSSDIVVEDGITIIPIKLDLNEKYYTEMLIKVDESSRTSAKSFSMEGWFRLVSNKEIVTVYGLDGTFEYDGTTATPTGSSGYHNSAHSGWSGTYSLSDEQDDNGTATIKGDYVLKKNGKYNNDAYCKAKCKKNGKITFYGNFDESSTF